MAMGADPTAAVGEKGPEGRAEVGMLGVGVEEGSAAAAARRARAAILRASISAALTVLTRGVRMLIFAAAGVLLVSLLGVVLGAPLLLLRGPGCCCGGCGVLGCVWVVCAELPFRFGVVLDVGCGWCSEGGMLSAAGVWVAREVEWGGAAEVGRSFWSVLVSKGSAARGVRLLESLPAHC